MQNTKNNPNPNANKEVIGGRDEREDKGSRHKRDQGGQRRWILTR